MSELSPAELGLALRTHYAIDGAAIEPTEAGQDVAARRFRVDSRYFVKVRPASDPRDAAATAVRELRDHGLREAVAPIRSQAGGLTVRWGEHSLSVYPLIDGVNGMRSGLNEQQWRAFGAFARQLHTSSAHLDLPAETYRPAELDLLPQIDAAVAGEHSAFWRAHHEEILALAARTEALGRELAQLALPLVVCHADLHTNNVMIDRGGALRVIDWDDLVVAPKERDLMFVIEGIDTRLVSPQQTTLFLDGYRDTATNDIALAYYRHAWAVQDIGGYGKQVFVDGVPAAFQRLASLFEPTGIVALAR
jgi:spectinomycin phosphotransferase